MSCLKSSARLKALLVHFHSGRVSVCPRWRRLRRKRVTLKSKQEDLDEAVSSKQREEGIWSTLEPIQFVRSSTAFYAGMTVSAIFLGRMAGLQVFSDLTGPLDVGAAFIWSLPMIGAMYVTAYFADRIPQLSQVKRLLQETILPLFRKTPPWGLIVLALGAGIGEETLFRGWMQPALAQKLMDFTPEYASLGSVACTGLIFGLGHAVTKTYFVWATMFGMLMGLEYNLFGLPTVALTHAIYDWVAFLTLTELWKPPREESK